MNVHLALLVFVTTATVTLAGRRRWRTRCGTADDGEREGVRFIWTRTGLRDDGLRATSEEGAFAPQGETTVFKYPQDRMMLTMGFEKAKVIYDFSTDTPVAVVRVGRRGWGPCILLEPDFDTYGELLEALQAMNMSNTEVPPESAEYTLVATETRDDSSFSQVVKDLCSKDHCGRPVQPVYYTTELAIDNGEGDVNATASDDPVFLLVEDRVAISGIDEDSARAYRRQNRRHHRRQMRRQHADQNGASNWRQRRRHHRRQRGN